MKKSLLLLISLFPSTLFAQKCVVSNHYTLLTGNQTQQINEPVSACFSDHYFDFYTTETGTISFEIDGPIERAKSNGTEVETFMNAESANVPADYYSVEIDNGTTKTVVISCYAEKSKGYDIMIESPSFVTNMDNSDIKPLKSIVSNKAVYDSVQAVNHKKHLQDSIMNAKTFHLAYYGGGRDSLYNFIGNHFKYNPVFKGYLTIAYTVDATGKVSVTNINHNLNNNAGKVPIDSIENNIKSIFLMMTKWRPGKNGDQPSESDFVQTFNFPMPSKNYPYLDTKAYFPATGGLLAFEDNVVAFPKGHSNSKGGTVYVQATIDAQGNVVNPIITHRDGDVDSKDFDKEAYSVVKLMTTWVPAKLSNGKPVDSLIEIPIVFKRSAP
jgi:hypothetical protein